MNVACLSESLQQIFNVKIRRVASVLHPHGYRARCRGGELEVCASTELGLAYGLHRVSIGAHSGYLEEFLGDQQPRFRHRILWLKDHQSPDVNRVIEWGFNVVLFNQLPEQGITSLREQGIAAGLAVQPPKSPSTRCPLVPEYQEAVVSSLQELCGLDVILWESQHLHPSFTEEHAADAFTLSELVQAELRLVESALPTNCNLIFYVPVDAGGERQAQCLTDLGHYTGEQTVLAFASTAGDPSRDDLDSNPIWNALRRQRDPSPMRLLPIINGGTVGLGQGLWPVLSSETVKRSLDWMCGPNFAGAIIIANTMPKGNGIAACNLWTGAQALWGGNDWAHTWFKASRPDLNFASHQQSLAIARTIAIDLCRFSHLRTSPSNRIEAELLVVHLKALEAKWSEEPEDSSKTTLADAFRYFLRDAWCLLYYHAERLRMPLPGVPVAVDHSGGFWCELTAKGRVVPGMATVKLLKHPRVDAHDSRMALLFNEN